MTPNFDEWFSDLNKEIDRCKHFWQRRERDRLIEIRDGGIAAQERHLENMRKYYERQREEPQAAKFDHKQGSYHIRYFNETLEGHWVQWPLSFRGMRSWFKFYRYTRKIGK